MTALRSSVLAAGLGGAAMFLLDPSRGNRRRALIRDKFVRANHLFARGACAAWEDLGNRAFGWQARTQRLFASGAADDATLEERVRSALGRVTGHHGAVTVRASNGFVTLSGDALASEVSAIKAAANRVRGVSAVNDDLRTHASAAGIPSLQGGSTPRPAWMSTRRKPAFAAAALAAGAVGAIALASATMGSVRTAMVQGRG